MFFAIGCEGGTTAPGDEAGESSATKQEDETSLDKAVTAKDSLGVHIDERHMPSLAGVIERRYLRVLTSPNSFDYFIDQGHHGGYQYELVKKFTRHLNRKYVKDRAEVQIQFQLLPVPNDRLIPMLLEGRGDLIATRLTITPERSTQVLFSTPYREVDELVVTHDQTGEHQFLHDLSGQTVAVRETSSYYASLVALNEKLESEGKQPVHIETVDEELGTESILALVAARRCDFTIADSIVAESAVAIWPELRILQGMAIREGGQLAWATHLTATDLAEEMNVFLARYKQGSRLGNVAVQKYFERDQSLRARVGTEAGGPLSAYDDMFKRHAQPHDFDWRLMAALAYQESRFEPDAHNRSGAVGLFQIKPMTAREPYIDIPNIEGPENVENNIEAGIKYLAWIKARYFDSDPEMQDRDRMRMALAAYNAGPRTLINARRRAEKMQLDPNRWFRNVELALLSMRKTEPVKYVSEINRRYLSYIMLEIE